MLEIENVSKTFHPNTPNQVRGLKNINLSLEDGSFVVVIGTNKKGHQIILHRANAEQNRGNHYNAMQTHEGVIQFWATIAQQSFKNWIV